MKTLLDTHPPQTQTAIRYAPPFAVGIQGALTLVVQEIMAGDLLGTVLCALLLLNCVSQITDWFKACSRLGVPENGARATTLSGAFAGAALWVGASTPATAPYGNLTVPAFNPGVPMVLSLFLLIVAVSMHLRILFSTLEPAPESSDAR